MSVFKGIFSWFFNTTIFEYLDEVIFLLSIGILLPTYLFSKKLKIIHFIILIFFIYSVLISVFFGYNDDFLRIVLQTLITIKFFIILLAFFSLFQDDLDLLKKFFSLVVKFAIVGLVIHLIFGVSFNNVVGVSTFARPNLRYVGFFTHPNHLAFLMIVVIGLILNTAKVETRILKISEWIKIVFAFLVILLTDSRTALLTAGLFFIAFYWKFLMRNYKILLGFMGVGIITVVLLLIYTDLYESISINIKDTFDLDSHYIRGNMIYLAATILWEFIPIGTGAASFGSVLSNTKVYEMYDQAHRYYFINEIGIYDSNIASIVGEYGLIGIVFFVAMFIYLKRYLQSFTISKNNLISTFLLIFLFYSITNPMLTNNLYVIISSIVLLLFVKPDYYKNRS